MPAWLSMRSETSRLDPGDETPASVETVDPGARLLGGPRGALPQSAADAALLPGAAPTGLTPEAGAWDDLAGHRATGGRVIRLYIIPGSNPSVAAELMLKRKGMD
jgi:hypothetical protein